MAFKDVWNDIKTATGDFFNSFFRNYDEPTVISDDGNVLHYGTNEVVYSNDYPISGYSSIANNADSLYSGDGIEAFVNLLNDSASQQQQAAQASADRAMEFSSEQAELQRRFNAAEAQKNRDFQTYMSNTSYQRAMADLEAAGLNPKLVGSLTGATTPSGSVASSSSPTGVNASMASSNVNALSSVLSSYISNAGALDRQQNDFAMDAIGTLIGTIVGIVL